ncbi:MAG: hypothetical protein ACLPUO_24895 [Streptosporangiaceae bacterium]
MRADRGDWFWRRQLGDRAASHYLGRSTGPVPQAAAAVVRLSSDCLWRVATRGITVTAARQRAAVSADQSLGSAVLHLVAIIR